MSHYYATIPALIFAIVALVHLVRLFRQMGGPDWVCVCADVCLVAGPDNFCLAPAMGIPTVELIAVQI
jgi:hypothetical protein